MIVHLARKIFWLLGSWQAHWMMPTGWLIPCPTVFPLPWCPKGGGGRCASSACVICVG